MGVMYRAAGARPGKRQRRRPPMSYRRAGVDIKGAARWLGRVAGLIRTTRGPNVLRDLGSFGGVYPLPPAPARTRPPPRTGGVMTRGARRPPAR